MEVITSTVQIKPISLDFEGNDYLVVESVVELSDDSN